mgnify:CR=1 FL=1
MALSLVFFVFLSYGIIIKINLMSTSTQTLEALASSIRVKDCISVSINAEVTSSHNLVSRNEL